MRRRGAVVLEPPGFRAPEDRQPPAWHDRLDHRMNADLGLVPDPERPRTAKLQLGTIASITA